MSTVNPTISSSGLFRTSVPSKDDPRSWYISRRVAKAPWIIHSHFIPPHLVEHLMRNKKSAAIAVKFQKNNHKPDKITNMEGALHTFVTPIVNCTMHGDYRWMGGHGIFEFGSSEGYQLGRRVLLSALVQQDYEDEDVMVQACRAGEEDFIGSSYFPKILSTAEKQNDSVRRKYDIELKRYMVHYLTYHHRLASRAEAHKLSLNVEQTIEFLGQSILKIDGKDMSKHLSNQYISRKDYNQNLHFISLEMMFRSAFHQMKNEFYGLETLCPQQGYLYTFNPPAIFVRFFGSQGTELLSRIHVCALKYLASSVSLSACRGIAWSDFNSPEIISLLRVAFASKPHIQIASKDDLFSNKHAKKHSGQGLYVAPEGAKSAMLVIHNNSDAFGQNIETEPPLGSLDGVIGSYSSAAASLLRHREDLCKHLIQVPA